MERLIRRKAANALIEDAWLEDARLRIVHPVIRQGAVQSLSAYKRAHGGLWVGGTVELTSEHLGFTPNAVNEYFTSGSLTFSIALADISGMSLERGVLTKIILIQTPQKQVRIRCFGAADFLRAIEAAIRAAST